ncbi:hypothetical protein LTR85_003478 [Meristemomyces frigidus]|nr:hypothetical protein LTR85_003478 [Meristemomyces frigidus]
MTSSAQVSVFEPNHLTRIIYPAYDIHGLKLTPPHDSHNRYEPRPLIQDLAVDLHASRLNEVESSIFSVTKATVDITYEQLESALEDDRSRPLIDGEGFVHDMHFFAQLHGETILDVVLYEEALGASSVMEESKVAVADMIKISRASRLPTKDGKVYKHYDSSTLSLEAFLQLDCDEPWKKNIQDAVFRRTDHAVRHVALQLGKFDVPDVPIKWKEARFPPYEECAGAQIRLVDMPDTLDADDRMCIICSSAYDNSEHTAFVPRCDQKHLICYADFLKWCQEKSAAEASCPHCRGHYFDKKAVEFLKYGTRDNTYSIADLGNDSFNPFETFERTCADLDHDLAENNTLPLRIDPRLVKQAWSIMIESAMREEAARLHWTYSQCGVPNALWSHRD